MHPGAPVNYTSELIQEHTLMKSKEEKRREKQKISKL